MAGHIEKQRVGMMLRSLLLLAAVATLFACGGNPAPPEPSDLLEDVRAAMQAVESMRAEGTITTTSEHEDEEATLITVEMAAPDRFRSKSEFIGGEGPTAGETIYVDGVTYTRSEGLPHFDDWSASELEVPFEPGPVGFLVPPEDLTDLTVEDATLDQQHFWLLRGREIHDAPSSDDFNVVEPPVTEWTAYIHPDLKLVMRTEIDIDHGVYESTNPVTGRTRTQDNGMTHMVWRGYDYGTSITVNAPEGVGTPTPEPTPTPQGVPFDQVLSFKADETPGPEAWDEVTRIVTDRLASMDVREFQMGVDGSQGVLTLQLASGTLTEQQARELVEATGSLQVIERHCLARPCNEEGNHEDAQTGLTGEDIVDARPARSSFTGAPIILATLRDEAAQAFTELTARLYETQSSQSPDQLAFILDGEVLVSGVVASPISDGELQIVGDFSEAEAEIIAALIATDPMPLSLRLVGGEAAE